MLVVGSCAGGRRSRLVARCEPGEGCVILSPGRIGGCRGGEGLGGSYMAHSGPPGHQPHRSPHAPAPSQFCLNASLGPPLLTTQACRCACVPHPVGPIPFPCEALPRWCPLIRGVVPTVTKAWVHKWCPLISSCGAFCRMYRTKTTF